MYHVFRIWRHELCNGKICLHIFVTDIYHSYLERTLFLLDVLKSETHAILVILMRCSSLCFKIVSIYIQCTQNSKYKETILKSILLQHVNL